MSNTSRISAEEKIETVRLCLSGKLGINEAARRIGVSKTVVRAWIRIYSTEGKEGFFVQTENRKYSPEEKESAVKEYLSGKGSYRDICAKYKIRDEKTIRSWIKVYNGHKDFKKHTGGSRMTKTRKTTQKERISIARECIESGRNYGELYHP